MARKSPTGNNIYLRKDGRWEGRLRVGTVNGKTIFTYIYASSYEEAVNKLAQLNIKQAETDSRQSENSFRNVAVEWINLQKSRLKPISADSFKKDRREPPLLSKMEQSMLLFLAVFHSGINGYMAASVSGVVIAALGMLIWGNLPSELGKAKSPGYKDIGASMLAYSTPLIAGTISWWLNSAGGKFILFLFCGSAANGIYAAAYKIPAVLAVFQDIFYNAWSVSAIEEFDKNDSDGFIGNVYMAYSALSVLACSVIMMINIFLVKFLYSDSFFDSWKYVPILLTGTVFSGLLRFLGCFYLAVKKTKTAAGTNILGTLMTMGLNVLLVPVMGAYGASVATLLGYASVWFIRIQSLRSIITLRVNWRREGLCYSVLLVQCIVAAVLENFIFQIPFFVGILLLYFPLIRKSMSTFHMLISTARNTH